MQWQKYAFLPVDTNWRRLYIARFFF